MPNRVPFGVRRLDAAFTVTCLPESETQEQVSPQSLDFSVPSVPLRPSAFNSCFFFFTSLLHCFFSSSTVPEQNHISLLHDVIPPFESHLRFLFRSRDAARSQQVVPAHHFRSNESLLNVAMNLPRRLRCRRSFANRPRPHFRLARREKLD